MSETAQYRQFGFDRNPFQDAAADDEVVERYELVGREDQEENLDRFVRDAFLDPTRRKRGLVNGDYGTGKSHHLIRTRNRIRSGITIDGEEYVGLAAYVGNLYPTPRYWYENITDEFIEQARGDGEEELVTYIENLKDIEPEDSVDPGYEYAKLVENIKDNLQHIAVKAREEHGYDALFVFTDEAEKLASEEVEAQTIRRFTEGLRDITDGLGGSGLHFLLGFSQKAKSRLAGAAEDIETTEGILGNALIMRFQAESPPIQLGNLSESATKQLLITRMDPHRIDEQDEGKLEPIEEATISVVRSATGGNPRSILSIHNDALQYARDADKDRIDGEAVFNALYGKGAHFGNEEILSKEAYLKLLDSIRNEDEAAASDLDNLKHRLIGEDESLPRSSFVNADPDDLTRSFTVEDTELRVLERSEEHGRYEYSLHRDVKDFIFGRQAGESSLDSDNWDTQVMTSIDKYQAELSRGLAQATNANSQLAPTGESYAIEVDGDKYEAWFIEYNPGPGYRMIKLAVAVYGFAQEPVALYKLLLEVLEERNVDFTVLVADGKQRSGDANRFLNSELSEYQDHLLETRLIRDEVVISQDLIEDRIYGKLLGLGDLEKELDAEAFDREAFIESLGLKAALDVKIDDVTLPYPDMTGQKVVNYLRMNDAPEIAMTDIEEEAEVDLDRKKMSDFEEQGLVAKEGHYWRYPDLEDNPPWKVIYRKIRRDGPVSKTELVDQLKREYVLQTPPGEESDLVQFYLNQLVGDDLVEGKETDEGYKYDEVDVTEIYQQRKEEAEQQEEVVEELLVDARDLDVNDVDDFSGRHEDMRTRIQEHSTLDPTREELNGMEEAVSLGSKLEEDLQESIRQRKQQIEGEVDTLSTQLEHLKEDMAEAAPEYADQKSLRQVDENWRAVDDFERWVVDVEDELEDTQLLVEEDEYTEAVDLIPQVREEIETARDNYDEFTDQLGELKQEIGDTYSRLQRTRSTITEISDDNAVKKEYRGRTNEPDDQLSEIEQHLNANELDKASEKLTECKANLTEVRQQAEETRDKQRNLHDEIADLKSRISGQLETEAEDLVSECKSLVDNGEFIKAQNKIGELEDLVTDSGKDPSEILVEAANDYDGRVASIIEHTDLTEYEVLNLLKREYGDTITEIRVSTD